MEELTLTLNKIPEKEYLSFAPFNINTQIYTLRKTLVIKVLTKEKSNKYRMDQTFSYMAVVKTFEKLWICEARTCLIPVGIMNHFQ